METQTYLFHREDMFYPIDFKDDAEAIANAECNEGTLKVTDLKNNIIWEYNIK